MTTRFAISHAAASAAMVLALAALGCHSIKPEIPLEELDPNTLDAVAATAGLTDLPWQPVRVFETTGATIDSMRVVQDLLFVQDSNHTIHAIDLASGTHRWVLNLDGPLSRPIIVGRDRIGFLTAHNHLTVAMRDSGNRLLDRSLDFTPSAPAAIAGDTLFTGSWGDRYRLRTVSLVDGWSGWYYPVNAPITAGVLVLGSGPDEMLYFATHDGDVAALPTRPSTAAAPREVNWRYRTLGKNAANLTGDDQSLYVASEDRALYALNRLVGAPQWKWFADAPLSEAPEVAAARVYQRVPGAVVCIDKSTGSEVYRASGMTGFLTTAHGLDWFACDDGGVAAVNPADGTQVRRLRSRLLDLTASNPVGGALLFSDGQTIFALR